MRDWFFAAGVVAMLFGLGFGMAIRPEMAMLRNAAEDLMFCELDLETARQEAKQATATASRKATERDRAIASSSDWQGWYEDAHRDRAALAAKLSAIQSELAAFRFAYEDKVAELAAARAELTRVAAVPILVKMEPKKKKRKRVAKRKPKPTLYRWHFF